MSRHFTLLTFIDLAPLKGLRGQVCRRYSFLRVLPPEKTLPLSSRRAGSSRDIDSFWLPDKPRFLGGKVGSQ